MDLIDKLTTANGIIGFLDDNSQKRIIKILKKLFIEKGQDRAIEECAVTMRSLANQIYEERKRNK